MGGGGFQAGSIIGKLVLDNQGWNAAVMSAKKDMDVLEQKAGPVNKAYKDVGGAFTAAGMAISGASIAIGLVGLSATKLAIDAVESENLFEVSMGNMATAARTWSNELSSSLGLNQYEIRKSVGTFNVMLGSMGLTTEAAYGMAKGLTQLSYDMASFYNLKPEEAFQKLQSGISGEIEPLKRLGIVVNEATTQHYALTKGLIRQGETMDEATKIQARYGVIMEATIKAQGDLNRTLDSPANQLRILSSRWAELKITLGQAVIPILKPVVGLLTNVVAVLQKMPSPVRDLVVVFGALVVATGPILLGVGQLLKMLPELRKAKALLIPKVGELNASLTTLGGTLKSLPLIAGAAFVGWKIGETLNEVTGLKKAFLTINWDPGGENVARMQELREVIAKIKTATGDTTLSWSAARKEYGSVANAISSLNFEYREQLAELAKHVKAGTDVATVSAATGKAFEALGIKTQVTAKGLAEMETNFWLVVNSGQATQKDIEKAAADLIEMKTVIGQQASPALKQLAGDFSDIEPMIPDLKPFYYELGRISSLIGGVFAPGVITGMEALKKTKEAAERLGVTLRTQLQKELKESIEDFTILAKQGQLTGEKGQEALLAIAEKARELKIPLLEIINLQLRMAGLGIQIPIPKISGLELAKEALNNFAEEFKRITADMAKSWSEAFVGMFGIVKTLVGEATKHNQAYFDKAMSDIGKEADARKKLLDDQMTAEEKAINDKYDVEEKALDAEYMNRRAYIIANVADEGERIKQLKELDSWKSSEEDRLRILGVEKERAKAAELTALAEKHAKDEAALTEWKASEERRILADQEKSRQEHADNEERRQNSLWTKVKTIFGKTVEDMLSLWITKLITPLISSIVDSILPSIEKIPKTAETATTTAGGFLGSLATSIGTIITTLASAIGTGIVAIATGIGTAIVGLATAIAGAATILAAAAPAIIIVGAIAVGLYAVIGAVNKLLGGGGKGDPNTEWLKMTHDLVREIHDLLFGDLRQVFANEMIPLLELIRDFTSELRGIGHETVGAIWVVADRISGLQAIFAKLSGAAKGHISTRPELLMVHGSPTVPEITAPLPIINSFSSERGGGTSVNQYFDISLAIKAEKLDDATIRQASEKIFSAIEFQAKRQGRRLALATN